MDIANPTDLKYKIVFEPKLISSSFNGVCTISFNSNAFSKIILDICELNIISVSDEFEVQGEKLIIKKKSTGATTIKIVYTGKINDDLHGVYKTRPDGADDYFVVTQFEPTYAKRFIPCFDRPSAKATFQLTLKNIPIKWKAFSNTKAENETSDGYLKTITFSETPKMSTYLLAFFIGDYHTITGYTKSGVEVIVGANHSHKNHLLFALENGIKAVNFFEEYTDIKYPLNQLVMLGIDDFASGAMENWGMITYRTMDFVFDETKKNNHHCKLRIVQVICHEIAHQWFGNLVTMKDWNDLWLNESFASWSETISCNALYPEWNLDELIVHENYLSARAKDSLPSTHVISNDDVNGDENKIDESFDAISYDKGCFLIYMLEKHVGYENFRSCIRKYLNKYQYGNAVADDLWDIFGDDIKKMMNRWIKTPGVPLLFVNKNLITSTYHDLFTSTRSNNNWLFPAIVNGQKKIINTANTIKINSIGGVFYGFVIYNKKSFDEMLTSINERSSNEIVAIIHDTFIFYYHKIYKREHLTSLLKNIIVNRPGISLALTYEALNIFRLTGNPHHDIINEIFKILNPNRIDSITWVLANEKYDYLNALRGDVETLTKYHTTIVNILKKKESYYSVDLQISALMFNNLITLDLVIAGINKNFWTYRDVYYGMCHSEDVNTFVKALNYGISKKVRSQDITYIFSSACSFYYHKNILVKFIYDNWLRLFDRNVSNRDLVRIFKCATFRINDVSHHFKKIKWNPSLENSINETKWKNVWYNKMDQQLNKN